jgi:dihydroorotase
MATRAGTVQVLPKGAITVGQEGKKLTEFAALRASGAVAVSDDGFAVEEAQVMRQAMEAAKQAGLSLTVHVDGPEMVERDIGLAAELGWMVHFSHLSLAGEVELIARAQSKGLPVSGEATPHHLWLSTDDTPTGDPNFKMNPPLRPARDRAALRSALAGGVVSVIASDHAPHAMNEKAGGYEAAPPGVIGLETTVGVIWTALVHAGRLSPERAVRAMTSAPAAVLNVKPPSLREGARADVTLLDPDREWVIEPENFESKARNCPFAERKVRGRAVATIVRGRVVMREGRIVSPGADA